MLYKYSVVCLVFTLVKNSVGDISLDYYFGIEDALRTAKYIENCNSDNVQESCQERCGPNHACILGKCFCVAVKPQIKKGEDLIKQLKEDAAASLPRHSEQNEDYDDDSAIKGFTNFKPSTFKSVIEELLRRSKSDMEVQAAKKNSSSESESEGTDNNYIKLDKSAVRPTLRHHIAHFCPNLDIARQCIRKCMAKRKPAFCGKNHVCYCGHDYGTPKDETNDDSDSEEEYTPFADLYEKYFGPKHKSYKHLKATITEKTIKLISKSKTKKVINTKKSIVDESTAEELIVDETTTDASTKDETTTEEFPKDETTIVESPINETTTGESPMDETTTGKAPMNETTTAASRTDDTITEESQTDEITTGEAATDETTTEGSPTKETTFELSTK